MARGDIDIAYDRVSYRGERLLIRSKWLPLSRRGEALFATTIFGDATYGVQEIPSQSEQECRTTHRSVVDRYTELEKARLAGMTNVLLEGVL